MPDTGRYQRGFGMNDIDAISTTPICKGNLGRPCVTDRETAR
jgi:hypothetical protein